MDPSSPAVPQAAPLPSPPQTLQPVGRPFRGHFRFPLPLSFMNVSCRRSGIWGWVRAVSLFWFLILFWFQTGSDNSSLWSMWHPAEVRPTCTLKSHNLGSHAGLFTSWLCDFERVTSLSELSFLPLKEQPSSSHCWDLVVLPWWVSHGVPDNHVVAVPSPRLADGGTQLCEAWGLLPSSSERVAEPALGAGVAVLPPSATSRVTRGALWGWHRQFLSEAGGLGGRGSCQRRPGRGWEATPEGAAWAPSQ